MVARPALTFGLQELREGVAQFRERLSCAELELNGEELGIRDPLALDLEISRVRDEVRIRGSISYSVEQACVRCLEPAHADVTAMLDVVVRPFDTDEDADDEPPDGMLYHDGETLSLAEEVRQAILVELPSTPLCRPDCRGLCPRCGGNLNQEGCRCKTGERVDPRWRALAALKGGDADRTGEPKSSEPPAGDSRRPDEET